MKIRLALVTEEFDGEIKEFNTKLEADAYSAGFSAGGGRYGAGNCGCYSLEEAQEHLSDAKGMLKKNEEDKYWLGRVDDWSEIIRALKKK